MSELQEQFEQASKDVQQLPARPDNKTLLRLYAYYKQATEGEAPVKRPTGFDFAAQAKYSAWQQLKGMAKEEAMQKYVELVNSLQE